MLRALLTAFVLAASMPLHAANDYDDKAQTLVDAITHAQEAANAVSRNERAESLGGKIRRDMLEAMPAGIADEDMAAEWQAVREGLGLESKDQLYIFVSFSMPDSLLRAYALDAARAGGILVFRGVEEGMNLKDFLAERLSLLVRPGLAATPVQIDPRLFDAYKIERAPTIVLAEAQDGPLDDLCAKPTRRYVEVDGKRVPHDRCPAQDDDTYWKISGSVTALYALEQFQERGAANAAPFIEALREAGAEPSSEQSELSSERWEALADRLMERNEGFLR